MNDRFVLVGTLSAMLCTATLAGTVRVDWRHQFTSATTVRVWADVFVADQPAQFAGVAGSLFSVIGTDSGATRTINFDENLGYGRLFQNAGASAGTLSGDDIMGVDAFQLPQGFNPGFVPGPSILEFFAFEYTFTDLTPRTIGFTSSHNYFNVYAGPFGTQGQNQEADVEVHATVIDFGGVVAMIPLPTSGAMAAIGMGLLHARRRR